MRLVHRNSLRALPVSSSGNVTELLELFSPVLPTLASLQTTSGSVRPSFLFCFPSGIISRGVVCTFKFIFFFFFNEKEKKICPLGLVYVPRRSGHRWITFSGLQLTLWLAQPKRPMWLGSEGFPWSVTLEGHFAPLWLGFPMALQGSVPLCLLPPVMPGCHPTPVWMEV